MKRSGALLALLLPCWANAQGGSFAFPWDGTCFRGATVVGHKVSVLLLLSAGTDLPALQIYLTPYCEKGVGIIDTKAQRCSLANIATTLHVPRKEGRFSDLE